MVDSSPVPGIKPENNTDPLVFDKPTRTSMDCHECNKVFVALIDYRITGNHIVECPHCGHEHCRVIEGGKVTSDRWSSRYGTDKDKRGTKIRRTWKAGDLPAQTDSMSEFMRQRWLEKMSEN